MERGTKHNGAVPAASVALPRKRPKLDRSSNATVATGPISASMSAPVPISATDGAEELAASGKSKKSGQLAEPAEALFVQRRLAPRKKAFLDRKKRKKRGGPPEGKCF